MSKEEVLKELFKNNEDWLGIAASYVGPIAARDVVQELYIAIDKWADERIITDKGTINRSYVFLTIRTLCFKETRDFYVNKDIVDNENKITSVDFDYEKERAWSVLQGKINNFIDGFHWYDKTLFKLYRDTPFSLRGLAKETGISWMSIHGTIKKCKDLLKEEFMEDYEDFKNGDYHLIK